MGGLSNDLSCLVDAEKQISYKIRKIGKVIPVSFVPMLRMKKRIEREYGIAGFDSHPDKEEFLIFLRNLMKNNTDRR